MPKLKIQTDGTDITVLVDGSPVGKLSFALQEQQAIEGVENPILVTGLAKNIQDGHETGLVFSVSKTIITALPPAVATTGAI